MGSSGMPYGLQSMLKDGHQHLSGLDEAVLKNIDACKQLSKITRTSLGPNGAGGEGERPEQPGSSVARRDPALLFRTPPSASAADLLRFRWQA